MELIRNMRTVEAGKTTPKRREGPTKSTLIHHKEVQRSVEGRQGRKQKTQTSRKGGSRRGDICSVEEINLKLSNLLYFCQIWVKTP